MSDALSSAELNTIEQCLREGFAPLGQRTGSKGSAIREAARRLGINPNTLISRYHASNLPESQSPDPIEIRRRDDKIAVLLAALKEAERRAIEALDIRQNVLGLTKEPLKPRLVSISPHQSKHGKQAVIVHLSDLHAGEVIRSPEILSSNSYNIAIFRSRIARLFRTVSDLITKHWPKDDRPCDEIIVCLGGDLVSGSIHPELAETNEGTDYQIFKEVAEHIAGGIRLLADETGLPIRVFSVPGNHGRMTLKPQSKRQGLMSWDILVSDMAEAALSQYQNVTWHRSEGTDCYFEVLGWPILLTHGHAMGSGGGQGFIGPVAPITRGHQKISHTELRQRRPIYLILSAHYHTTVKTPWGWGNGSLVGYNEYVRNNRGEAEPAQQNMLVLHEHRGLIRYQPVYVGDPSEGTLYQGATGWLAPMRRVEEADEAKENTVLANDNDAPGVGRRLRTRTRSAK